MERLPQLLRRPWQLLTAPLSGRQVVINGYALCRTLLFVRGCYPGPAWLFKWNTPQQ